MFVGGFADALIILLVLAGLGIALLIAVPLTLLIKFSGMSLQRAAVIGFGIPSLCAFLAGIWFWTQSAPDGSTMTPQTVHLPEAWSDTEGL